ncbi:YbaY family lipoprotein [Aeromicrobium sp.]|uniref:YbaY family lipoprotein n=1 Tax=Aeromicrobium sp. TaxID=1871063 RepID=UPI003C613FB1
MASAPLLTVHGNVFFRERVAVRPGVIATVKLVDTEGEVLAATAIDAPGVPAEFSLHVDPEFVADPEALLIWAVLRTEAGIWGTTELVPLTSGSTEVLVTKIDD